MRYEIDIIDEVEAGEETADILIAATVATLVHLNIEPPQMVSILITDDNKVHQLNRDFRDIDKSTDVLSFPAGEQMPGMPPYLGDLAISLPQVKRQSETEQNPLSQELKLMAVHGTLHLLGYDHGDEVEKAAMWAVQTAVLQTLT